MNESNLILVVDDNETGRYIKSRTLRLAGFEVIESANGRDALRLVAESQPRLVVLDVQLPDIDGWEVCRLIKANPETSSVLVLQFSATYVQEKDTVRALEGGADACLTHPAEAPVLVATVRALLRTARAEESLRAALARETAARVAAEGAQTAAEAANRIKDEFLATLSHELRSPLGTILNWMNLLRSGTLDAAQTERAFEAIERNARLQAKLVDDLLDVSRIISGKMRFEVGLVELSTIVSAAIESIRPAAEAKEIQITQSVDPTLGPVSGDATRLQQIVWNLISNAVKFTPSGGSVEVRVDRDGSSVQITVTDTGRGINPEFLPHVFERFRQAESSSTRAEGGLGLGLAIVRHLVELHGGTAEAASRGLGSGASFIVRLPQPRIGRPSAGARVASAGTQPRTPGLDGVRILIVDDTADARDVTCMLLESNGAAVATASSVQEALRAIDAALPHIILTDIAMPLEDGYELLRRLRLRPAEEGGSIPVVALSAYSGNDERQRSAEAGFAALLTKPIDVSDLITAIVRAVPGRSPEDEPPARG